jgi:hypothetical protein
MNGLLEAKKKADKCHPAEPRITQADASRTEELDRPEGLKKKCPPMSSIFDECAAPTSTATKTRAERRRERRASVKCLVRLRPGDQNDPKFEEVLGTLNASRANLYVITSSKSYYKYMRLRVTFPYDAAYDRLSAQENTAEVVRLDHLPGGRTGVAILLQNQIGSPSGASSTRSRSAGQSKSDKRITIRQAISAEATMIEIDSRIRLRARCSDLSMAGCYIDTLNPFLKGSRLLLQLTSKGVDFVAIARVISHHTGMGMGLAFEGLREEQKSVLAGWLSKRPVTSAEVVEEFQTRKAPASGSSEDSSDRALLLKLVSLLESSGKLVPF